MYVQRVIGGWGSDDQWTLAIDKRNCALAWNLLDKHYPVWCYWNIQHANHLCWQSMRSLFYTQASGVDLLWFAEFVHPTWSYIWTEIHVVAWCRPRKCTSTGFTCIHVYTHMCTLSAHIHTPTPPHTSHTHTHHTQHLYPHALTTVHTTFKTTNSSSASPVYVASFPGSPRRAWEWGCCLWCGMTTC